MPAISEALGFVTCTSPEPCASDHSVLPSNQMRAELEWVRSSPKARQAKNHARLDRYEQMEAEARADKGTLLASGFIAGGALMGVVSAGLQFGGYNFADKAWLASPWSTLTACVLYVLLIIYLIKASLSD